MSKQIDTATNSIHLQSIGRHAAKRADALVVGDVTVWNYGATETVRSIVRSSPQYVTAVIVCAKGVEYTRRMKIDRMVAVAA